MRTVFKIYLPCVEGCDRSDEIEEVRTTRAARGSETVLLVEDEQAGRQTTSEFLKLQGYTVLEALSIVRDTRRGDSRTGY